MQKYCRQLKVRKKRLKEFNLTPFYEAKKLSEESCWESCGGSHCCKLFRFFKDLKFAEKNSQVLHLYDFEVQWLISNNQLDPEFKKTLKKFEYKVNNWPITFYTVNCGYGGLCPNHKYRPLSCFLYPYIPYFSESGKIEKLSNLSMFDDLYDDLKIKKPCTLYPKFSMEMYQSLIDSYLGFNGFYFYTNIYFRIKEIMNESFKKENDETEFEKALSIYEVMFAMKKLITLKEVENIVIEENKKFKLF